MEETKQECYSPIIKTEDKGPQKTVINDIDDGIEQCHTQKKANTFDRLPGCGDILLQEKQDFSTTVYRSGFIAACEIHDFVPFERSYYRDPLVIYCKRCGSTIVTTISEK